GDRRHRWLDSRVVAVADRHADCVLAATTRADESMIGSGQPFASFRLCGKLPFSYFRCDANDRFPQRRKDAKEKTNQIYGFQIEDTESMKRDRVSILTIAFTLVQLHTQATPVRTMSQNKITIPIADELSLTKSEASHFAQLALKCVSKEYPN